MLQGSRRQPLQWPHLNVVEEDLLGRVGSMLSEKIHGELNIICIFVNLYVVIRRFSLHVKFWSLELRLMKIIHNGIIFKEKIVHLKNIYNLQGTALSEQLTIV